MDDDTAERIRALEAGQLKIRGLLGEVASVVWGDMVKRDNGLRARVGTVEDWKEGVNKWIQGIESRLNHYWDAEREATCHGLKALAEHEQACVEAEEEEVDVKVAQIHAGATKGAAGYQSVAMIVVQLLTLVGIIVVALK